MKFALAFVVVALFCCAALTSAGDGLSLGSIPFPCAIDKLLDQVVTLVFKLTAFLLCTSTKIIRHTIKGGCPLEIELEVEALFGIVLKVVTFVVRLVFEGGVSVLKLVSIGCNTGCGELPDLSKY